MVADQFLKCVPNKIRVEQLRLVRNLIEVRIDDQQLEAANFADGVQIKVKSEKPFIVNAYWIVNIADLHHDIGRDWEAMQNELWDNSFLNGNKSLFQNRFQIYHQSDEQVICDVRPPQAIDISSMIETSRDFYPLVIIVSCQEEEPKPRATDAVATILIVHIQEDIVPNEAHVIKQYIKQIDGRVLDATQLYVKDSSAKQASFRDSEANSNLKTSYTKQVFLITLVIISLYAFIFQSKSNETRHIKGERNNEIRINLEQVNRLNLNYPGLLSAKQLRLIKARIAVMKSEVSILMLLGKTRDSHCKLDPTFCVGQTIANVTQLQFGYVDASDPYLNSNELKNELGKAFDNYRNPVIIDSLEQLPGAEVMNLFQFIDKDESHQRRGMLILIVYTGNYQVEAKAPTERIKEADIAEKVLLDRWSYFIPRDSLTSVLSRMCGSIVKVY